MGKAKLPSIMLVRETAKDAILNTKGSVKTLTKGLDDKRGRINSSMVASLKTINDSLKSLEGTEFGDFIKEKKISDLLIKVGGHKMKGTFVPMLTKGLDAMPKKMLLARLRPAPPPDRRQR